MDSVLEFDLNELVSKQVFEEMQRLNQLAENLARSLHDQREENRRLKSIAEQSSSLAELLELLRLQFDSIKSSEPDSGGWYDSQQKNQFSFISGVMELVFGIKGTQGWLSSRGDGRLSTYLAVSYYDHKDEIIKVIKVLSPKQAGGVNSFISSFKMPYDYDKSDVMAYVSRPHYCTNGAIFGVSQYWIERGAGKENMPHNLIMQNKHILEPDAFSTLMDSIRTNKGNSQYLFALTKYNDAISPEQISEMGRALIGRDGNYIKHGTVSEFAKVNMSHFDEETLDHLMSFSTASNQYNTFHWENFPRSHQVKFISGMDIDGAIKALTNYSCKLTPKDKADVLREVLDLMTQESE